MIQLDDIIVAVSSAVGPAPRGIIRLSGPGSIDLLSARFHSNTSNRPRSFQPGLLTVTGFMVPVPCDAYTFRAPNSATGQDTVELHTIGSPPIIDAIVADFLQVGARAAEPGEFTLRGFLAGKKNLPQAEAVLAVIHATSETDLKLALKQLAGGLTEPLAAIREDLLNLVADTEAALDFADEDLEFVSQPETILRIAKALAYVTNVRRQLQQRTLTNRAIRIVLVGEPNAGKSSLFNALLGEDRAIVSDLAGTTRDVVSASLNLDGLQVELLDTAGWQQAKSIIEEQAQELGRHASDTAQIVLHCTTDADSNLLSSATDVLRVQTKVDDECDNPLSVSIHRPESIERLKGVLHARAIERAQPPLAPSHVRCQHHVDEAITHLRSAHLQAVNDDPPELLALSLRAALDSLGAMTGAIYTNDLLDRIFSRFCIGK
jgi:tRNA modification GTPase